MAASFAPGIAALGAAAIGRAAGIAGPLVRDGAACGADMGLIGCEAETPTAAAAMAGAACGAAAAFGASAGFCGSPGLPAAAGRSTIVFSKSGCSGALES